MARKKQNIIPYSSEFFFMLPTPITIGPFQVKGMLVNLKHKTKIDPTLLSKINKKGEM